jgi:hypothetical protein
LPTLHIHAEGGMLLALLPFVVASSLVEDLACWAAVLMSAVQHLAGNMHNVEG